MFKVGITGWAQVKWLARRPLNRQAREYDLYYLRNCILTSDLQIIVITLLNMFSSKNAY